MGYIVNNIADAKKIIREKQEERRKIYDEKISHIDDVIRACEKYIKENCTHHNDLLEVNVVLGEDEFGTRQYGWDKYEIKCSICGSQVEVNRREFDSKKMSFSEAFITKREV